MTLKERRLANGLTMEQVASEIDVSHAAVCHWETGKRKILRKHAKRLAALYGCTVEELLEGKAEAPAETLETGA